ncbi:MAG TPA: hypothetical protein VHW44_00640 [Pseudonocardiaceae bacterium]|jgi:hypothetical protein|nr:hypothetical protein [Pseudonocardiaceae bacterium]
MDFPLHERRLALIEQDLAADRRLVSLMSILDTNRSKRARLLRYLACRIRHPWRRQVVVPHYRLALLSMIFSGWLLVAGAALLVTAFAVHSSVLAVVTVSVSPLLPLLFLVTRRWVQRLRLRGTTG